MQLFVLFIDGNAVHVSSVSRSSSGAQETVCAARCRVQLFLILSFCSSRVVSVQGFVGPGLVCVKIVSDSTTHSAHYPVDNHRTPIQDTQNLAQIQHVTNRKTESRIIEHDTWLHTQFPELLMMSE